MEETAIYWVHHYAHRISHPAKLAEGEEFPTCRICGDQVRFEKPAQEVQKIEENAPPISRHTDFRKVS